MQRYVQTGYGDVRQNILLGNAPDPVLTGADLLVDIHAASLNPIDFKIVHGDLKRAEKIDFPSPMGFDGSGIVAAKGPNARTVQAGDAVFFRAPRERQGSFAERFVIDERHVAAKPQSLSHLEAASLPLVALTTVQGLVDRAKAKRGQSILIHAGSGGVGSFAIQYAEVLGLEVSTTTSSRNVEMVKTLGADHVIAYDQKDYRAMPARYDIVFDTLGGQSTLDAFAIVNPGGAVVSVVGPPSAEMAAQLNANGFVRIVMAFMRRNVMAAARRANATYWRYLTESNAGQLGDIAAMAAGGTIKPVIDRSFAFEKLADAMEYLETGRARGKVMLNVRE